MNSRYDPIKRIIFMRSGATIYERFHELAHKEFHEMFPATFEFLVKLYGVPFIRVLAILILELEAHYRAKYKLLRLRMWKTSYDEHNRHNINVQAFYWARPIASVIAFVRRKL